MIDLETLTGRCIYFTDHTREEFDWLMDELAQIGYHWPDDESTITTHQQTLRDIGTANMAYIVLYEDRTIQYGYLPHY